MVFLLEGDDNGDCEHYSDSLDRERRISDFVNAYED